MRRRTFLSLPAVLAAQGPSTPFTLTDVTKAAGLQYTHFTGATGRKYLPETLGPGCAFIDYDNDGWPDIVLVNGMPWQKDGQRHRGISLYHNNRDGTFTDVTHGSGLDVELYGLGIAVGDFNNDGLPDIYVTTFGQNRLFRNLGNGKFMDVTVRAGLGGRNSFSSSAIWFDYDRDGLLDLFVCNYVKWSPKNDTFCSMDGMKKAYCTPEAYSGSTSWLFRNRGDGTFEDVTVKAGLFDSSSKSLGVALLDYDSDGWPDLFVANDTQPNKLYRNQRNGTFREIAVQAGVAFSEDGKARAGMGVDAADLDGSGRPSLLVTNFQNEMLGLYRLGNDGSFVDFASSADLGRLTRNVLGFGCFFFDADLDGKLDILVANGHIDETVASARPGITHAQSPQLFLNQGEGRFRDYTAGAGRDFSSPKIGRGAAYADFDLDGDQDVLLTTNGGPAYLYRNDQKSGNKSIRVKLIGTKSNRDAIGAVVEAWLGTQRLARTVKGGSSYLSQSELPITFGLGKRDVVDRLVIRWPSGRVEEYKNLAASQMYTMTEQRSMVSRSFPKR